MLPDAIIPAADVVALAWLEAMDDDEIDHQRDIVKAREYHAGEQHVFLTERLREYINVNNDADFNLNICGTVVRPLAATISSRRPGAASMSISVNAAPLRVSSALARVQYGHQDLV